LFYRLLPRLSERERETEAERGRERQKQREGLVEIHLFTDRRRERTIETNSRDTARK